MASTAPSNLSNQLAPQTEKKKETEPDRVKVGTKRGRDAAEVFWARNLIDPDKPETPEYDSVEVGIKRVLDAVNESLEKIDNPLSEADEGVRGFLANKDVEYEDDEEIEKLTEKLFGNGSLVGYNIAHAQLGMKDDSRYAEGYATMDQEDAFRNAPECQALVQCIIAAGRLEYCEKHCEEESREKEDAEDEDEEMSRIEYYERNLEMLVEALDCGGWRAFLDALREEDYAEAFAAYQDLGEYEYVQSAD